MHNAADRARAPERALGATHHLDSFDIRYRKMGEIVRAAEGVDLHAVDLHECEIRLTAAWEQ